MTLLYMLKKASKIAKKVFIRLFPLLMKVTDQVPCSFHSKNFYNDKWVMVYCMNLNAASLFILLQMFPNFLMLLSTGNITLCENKVEASEMTKKFPFACFRSWWKSLCSLMTRKAPKCTSRWCLSTEYFFWAAEETCTE